MLNNSPQMHLKLLKKTAEEMLIWIGNKNVVKTTKISGHSPQNGSERVESEIRIQYIYLQKEELISVGQYAKVTIQI